MKLIKKIEVNYFRSLYNATMDNVADLNIIFGRNDSGKSNLLRALNLFFNDVVDSGNWLDFNVDMSDARRERARAAKGRQFIWIKITFSIPENYQNSLGVELSVKRQWNRDGEMNQTVFPSLKGSGKQARLTRFLNEIDFRYIPAVKDIEVYADLIETMYQSAAETDSLREATERFVDAIEGQTTSLSQQLTKLFGGPARLAPPTEMSRLFRNLDFAHGDDGHSLLRQKGDGIKARHIPELLRFINTRDSRKRFYVWGFEEPENSLDLGAAEVEAERFCEFAGRLDTQIFVTSHSPAFYLVDEKDTCGARRYFVTTQTQGAGEDIYPSNAISQIDKIEDAEARMEGAGLMQLPFVIRHLDSFREENDIQSSEIENLQDKLRDLSRPTLFVEGKHDVSLFLSSFKRIGAQSEISVKSLGGTPNNTQALIQAIQKNGGVNTSAKTLFLFDDDKSGRGAFRNLTGENSNSRPHFCSTNIYAWLIQETPEFIRFKKKFQIAVGQEFFTSEFLFPADGASQICWGLIQKVGGSLLEEWQESVKEPYVKGLNSRSVRALFDTNPGTADWFFARGVPASLKQEFADAVDSQDLDTSHIDMIAKFVAGCLIG